MDNPFWNEAVKEVASTLSAEEHQLWFTQIQLMQVKDSKVIVQVPSAFYRDQFKRRYQKSIEKKLEILSGRVYSLDYSVNPEKLSTQTNQLPDTKADALPVQPLTVHAETYNVNPRLNGLNPVYTFDSFVVGENNQFAANATIAIAKNPGTAYNPCLIYGKVGLGKTHLLQSVGNYILAHRPKKSVICVTAEDFTNEFIRAIQHNAMHAFKLKYREVDVLLIDDVHFLQKKTETQEELFHTFNALFETKKQMVFTCDRPMSEIRDITERLQNRFTRGLTVDLQPPKIETAVAILQKKAIQRHVSVPTDVLHYICQNIRSNVRDLEAALTKVIHSAEVMQTEISIQTIKPTLQDMFQQSSRTDIPIALIQKAVAEYYSTSVSELKGKSRINRIVFPRKVAVYLARTFNKNVSYSDIGLEFGGRDHTTIIHSYQNIEQFLKRDPHFSNVLERIIASI